MLKNGSKCAQNRVFQGCRITPCFNKGLRSVVARIDEFGTILTVFDRFLTTFDSFGKKVGPQNVNPESPYFIKRIKPSFFETRPNPNLYSNGLVRNLRNWSKNGQKTHF